QGVGVAALEIASNGCATRRILDDDEPPGLAQSHRRSKTRQMDEPLQSPGRERIAPEAADVPSPHEQLAQACAKTIVELPCPAAVGGETLDLRHAPSLDAATAASRVRRSRGDSGRRDQQDSHLADLLQGAQYIAGLAADLPHAQPPQQRELGRD